MVSFFHVHHLAVTPTQVPESRLECTVLWVVPIVSSHRARCCLCLDMFLLCSGSRYPEIPLARENTLSSAMLI